MYNTKICHYPNPLKTESGKFLALQRIPDIQESVAMSRYQPVSTIWLDFGFEETAAFCLVSKSS